MKQCRGFRLDCANDTVAFTYAARRLLSESAEKNPDKLSNNDVSWMFRLRHCPAVPDGRMEPATDLDLTKLLSKTLLLSKVADDLPLPSVPVTGFLEGRRTSEDLSGEMVTRGLIVELFDDLSDDLAATTDVMSLRPRLLSSVSDDTSPDTPVRGTMTSSGGVPR